MECRKRAYHADHYSHGMSIAAETGIEPDHLLMRHCVLHDGVFKRLVLLESRQLAVKQEIGCFKKRAVLGELLNRIPTQQHYPLVEIDEGDFRLAAGG